MELTKAQITEVEEYLKAKGVKYWDIRIEMLDHIATNIEQQMELGNSFEEAKREALKEKGWNQSIKGILFQQLQSVNRKVRGQYFREFAKLFTNLFSLALMLLTTFFLVLLYSKIDYGIAKNINLTIYYLPSLLAFGFVLGTFLFKQSAYMQYGGFYMIFSFMILNIVLLIARDASVADEVYKWIYLAVAIVNSLAIYAGIKTYLSVRKEVQQMQKQLKLL